MFKISTVKRRAISSSDLFSGIRKKIQFKKRGIKLSKSTLLLVPLVLFITGAIFWIINEEPFTIKRIECLVNGVDCSNWSLSLPVDSLSEKTLFTFTEETVVQKIMYTYPEVGSVRFKKQIPNLLIVNIEPRTPIALVEDVHGQRYFIDGEGKVFARGEMKNLPVIKVQESVANGVTTVSPAILASLKLVQSLDQSALPAISIIVKSLNTLEVDLPSGRRALFSGERDIVKQVDALQFILQNSTMGEKEVREIDLRYDNPVVKSN